MIYFAGRLFGLFLLGFIAFWAFVFWRRRSPRNHAVAKPDHAAAVIYGTQLLADDVQFFKDWSSAMLREFDDIAPYLPIYFTLSERMLRKDRASWAAEATALVASSEKLVAAAPIQGGGR